jgi:hypothetical protein
MQENETQDKDIVRCQCKRARTRNKDIVCCQCKRARIRNKDIVCCDVGEQDME